MADRRRGPRGTARRILHSATLLLLAGCASPGTWQATFLLGEARHRSSDLGLRDGAGTDLVLHDVGWRDASWEAPVFYGLRLTRWLAEEDGFGLALDFTHAKAILDPDQVVETTGQRAGAPAAGRARIARDLQAFEASHGHNILLVLLLHRWRLAGRPGEGGLWLHAGSGAGPAIPHVEALRQGRRTSGYQLTGPAWAILAGLEWNPIPWLGLVLEARMSRALLDMGLAGGDELRTRIESLAITGGLAVRF